MELTAHVDGRIKDIKVNKVEPKVEKKTKKDGKETVYVRGEKGKVYAQGTYNPKKWSQFYYGHNTPDVECQSKKARYLDDDDDFGRRGVRLQRFCEISLETITYGDLEEVFDKVTTISSDGGSINCSVKSMTSDEHTSYYIEGLGSLVNAANTEHYGKKRIIDMCFYDCDSGREWPREVGDSPLIHGQMRVIYEREWYGGPDQVKCNKLLLVQSLVLPEDDKRAKGHSENGRYFIPYLYENARGKRFKGEREYYDRKKDHFWMKNKWYQKF